jgi:hypothetical protein
LSNNNHYEKKQQPKVVASFVLGGTATMNPDCSFTGGPLGFELQSFPFINAQLSYAFRGESSTELMGLKNARKKQKHHVINTLFEQKQH